MKKAYNKFRKLNCIYWIIVCFFLFNFTSCGLDTFYVIEAPRNVIHQPDYSNADKILNYFEFETYEDWYDKGSEFKFAGTDVYYRIYNNYTTMKNEIDNVVTLADSTTTSSNATSTLTSTYKYQKVTYTGHKASVLIPFTGKDAKIRIRLTDYQDSASTKAVIMNNDVEMGFPLRYGSDGYTFNFGRTKLNTTINRVPESGEPDVKYGSFSSTGVWYVAMFAVAVGRDATFTDIVSTPLYLGSVAIDANDEDN